MVNILMMGNSYLYKGNQPGDVNGPAKVFERLADLGGHDVTLTQSYLGGDGLSGHWDDMTGVIPRNELATGTYDVIVMAGSDDGISTNKTDDDTPILAEYGRRFVNLARENGTQAVFYEPWVPDFAVAPGSDSFTPAISRLYRRVAEVNDAAYSPNAAAYKAAYDAFYQRLGPDGTGQLVEDLLTFDGIHASPHGALLIASVLYGTIFGEPAPVFRPPGVSAEEAAILQDIARQTVQRDAITLAEPDPTPPVVVPPVVVPPPVTVPPVTVPSGKIEGSQGADVLDGTAGADDMDGKGGSDDLISGDGDDRLDGGSGNDRSFGGSGNDVFIFDNNDTHYFGGSGRDVLEFDGGTSVLDMRLVSIEELDLKNDTIDRLTLQTDDVRQAKGDLMIMADDSDVIRLQTNQSVANRGRVEVEGEIYDRIVIGGSDAQSFLIDVDASFFG